MADLNGIWWIFSLRTWRVTTSKGKYVLTSYSHRNLESISTWASRHSPLQLSKRIRRNTSLQIRSRNRLGNTSSYSHDLKLIRDTLSWNMSSVAVKLDSPSQLTLLFQMDAQISLVRSTTLICRRMNTWMRFVRSEISSNTMTQINKFQFLVLAQQSRHIRNKPTIALPSMATSLIQKLTVLMESLMSTRTPSARWTYTDQPTSHQSWDSSTKWPKTCSAHSRTRSTLSFWSSPTESLATCRKPLTRSCMDHHFHCRSLLWESVVLTSALWTSSMPTKPHFTLNTTESKCRQISCSSCHSETSLTTPCSSQRKLSKKSQDKCLDSSGPRASNLTQRLRPKSVHCSNSFLTPDRMADKIQ